MKTFSTLTLALACALPAWQAPACTLWGASGAASTDGTLLAKNRDWLPNHVQTVQLRHPFDGLAFVALYADTGSGPTIRDGVNEAGLAVVTAEASSLPKSVREAQHAHGVMTRLLTHYRSVDQIEADGDKLFTNAKPVFLMIADSKGLATVEVGVDGHYAIKRQADGTMAHTNHYLDTGVIDREQKIGPSSATRFARINTLLSDPKDVHTLAEFSRISGDRHDGPDNSLWRNGHETTLAGWQIALPANAPPHLHLLLANPGETRKQYDLQLDAAFWAQREQTLEGQAAADGS